MKLLHSSICVASLQFIYFSFFFAIIIIFFFLLLRRFSALQSCLILRYKIHSQSCYINCINVHIAYGFMDQICSQKNKCTVHTSMFKIRKRKKSKQDTYKIIDNPKMATIDFYHTIFFFSLCHALNIFNPISYCCKFFFRLFSFARLLSRLLDNFFFLTFNLYVRPIDVPIDFFLYANQVEYKLRKLIAKKKTFNVGWRGGFYLSNILIMGEN